MFAAQNLTAVTQYVSGKKLEPHKGIDFSDLTSQTEVAKTSPWSIKLDPMLEPEALAKYRWNRNGDRNFDMRDELVGTWQGSRTETMTLGRLWNGRSGGFKLDCHPGLNYGDTQIGLAPAVAALASSTITTGVTGAWGILHQILGVGGQLGAVDTDLMASLNRVHGSTVNTVRFVHRLAALYWHCIWAADRGETQLDLVDAPYATLVNSVPQVVGALQSGLSGTQFIPWDCPGALDNASMQSVLYAAGCGRVRAAAGHQNSRAVKVWPSLGGNVRYNVKTQMLADALNQTRTVTLDAGQVWFAAVRWVARYSNLELWDEAVQFVGGVICSPCRGIMGIGDTCASYSLPECAMGAFALGPLIEPIDPMTLGNAPREPAHDTLIESACVTALVTGLVNWNLMWKVCGWYYAHGLATDAQAGEYWRRFLRTNHVTGSWSVAQTHINRLLAGNVGRIWGTVSPSTGQLWKKLRRNHCTAPQWEELLGRSTDVAMSAGIYGLLFPLQPTRATLQRHVWSRAVDFPNSSALDHVYYGLISCLPRTVGGGAVPAIATPVEIAYTQSSMGFAGSAFSALLDNNYRGTTADHALFAGFDAQGRRFEPVIRVTDQNTYYALTDPTTPCYHTEWFIESPEGIPTLPPLLAEVLGPAVGPAGTGGRPGPPRRAPESDAGSVSGEESDSEDNTSAGAGAAATEETDAALASADGSMSALATLKARLVGLPPSALRSNAALQAAAGIERASAAGVPDAMLEPLSRWLNKGTLPLPGQADPGFDAVIGANVRDYVERVSPERRSLVTGYLAFTLRHLLSITPPGTAYTDILRRGAGMAAASKALARNPALTAEEALENLGRSELEKMGFWDSDAVRPDTRSSIARGRLPDPVACERLLESGATVLVGIARRGHVATSQPVGAVVEQDSVESFIVTLIQSALDVGATPDVAEIEMMVGEGMDVAALVAKVTAAHELASKATVVGAENALPTPSAQAGGSGQESASPATLTEQRVGQRSAAPQSSATPWRPPSRFPPQTQPAVVSAAAANPESGPLTVLRTPPVPDVATAGPSTTVGISGATAARSTQQIATHSAPSGEAHRASSNPLSGVPGLGDCPGFGLADPRSGAAGSAR